ncbi:N-acetylmuramoyl-L-alanine amidase [Alteromonas sp. LMIT006]|jgi:N-acetylmuramoyl-L-alanine amidase|uniref:N-acetylmuramoyl-L-alanine amidase n=1 Tax=Alteromonadaceae TaxID=72275 RepID=UPI0020CA7141|nr:N-acetylmuramoyl-L-alanine amidase [Alteromonas sp. LMIT006]UTP73428.1 N-acetylmuramoyl-L-alanine amidase [Alteromonas sp. LMIT006]
MRQLKVYVLASVLYWCFCLTAIAQTTLSDATLKTTSQGTRIEFSFSETVKHSYFTLQKPYRVVIDLPNTQGQFATITERNSDRLVHKVRTSKPKRASDFRIVIETRSKEDFTLGWTGTTLWVQFSDPPPAVPKLSVGQQPDRPTDIIIALDAGHGGRDPGSVGPTGTYEKHVVLSIAKKVAERIDATPGLRAVLTRTDDYYIKPSKRPEIARQKMADLLISIHADAFTTPQPSGASVWLLNNRRANSELAKWLRNTEKHSELLGGAGKILEETEEDEFLMRTLLDMQTESSQQSSYQISKKMLLELNKVTKLHKKSPQHASLAVLTAPDIPSILVEVGFISNPREEKNLNWSAHRERLAGSIYDGIVKYFRVYPPEGTLWAMQKNNQPVEHRVASGESLTRIAQRYRVSVGAIKQHNGLTSDVIRVGQRIKIPQG